VIIITCKELVELATDKKEGTLRPMQSAGITLHLAWCTSCRTYLRQMDLTVETTREIGAEHVGDDVRAALLEQFKRSRRTK
jgi:predicted anti-sigma-YlaC factor YlaD